MENIKKRDSWSDREIRHMLSIINEKHILQLIDSKPKRNKSIFVDIASELKKKQIVKSDVQIRNKFKSLKSDFYKAKRNNKSRPRRQTSVHFELLNEIFGNRPRVKAEGVDVIEVDVEEMDAMHLLNASDDLTQTTDEENSFSSSQDEESSAASSKSLSTKRPKKNSYENSSMGWKEAHRELLQTMAEKDEKLVEIQPKKQEEMLEKNLNGDLICKKMENIKKRDAWCDREIRQMLSIINEKHVLQLIDSKPKRNKRIFVDIASELKKKQIIKSDVQIRNKFKSLKSDFYKAKRNNNKSGAKRQTSEHFELLNEIFGNRPAVKVDGVDIIEEDFEEMDVTNILNASEDLTRTTEEENSFISSHDEESRPTRSKLRGTKRTKKNSYQKVVETFTMDWKETQRELLQTMQEHDEKLVEIQTKKQEEILEKNLKGMEKILEKDREETAKMLQGFLTAMQTGQPTLPYLLQTPPSYPLDPLSYNANLVRVPKLSPQDTTCTFP